MGLEPITNFLNQGIVDYNYLNQTIPSYFNNVLDESYIEKLLTFLKKNNLNPNSDSADGTINDELNRFCCKLPYHDITFNIYKNILECVIESNKKNYNLDLSYFEHVDYCEYYKSITGLEWHIDIGPKSSNKRKLSFILFLNDANEYEGGNLEIWNDPDHYQIPNTKGGLVVFPSFLLHRLTPIKKGTRKVIIGHVSGTPYR